MQYGDCENLEGRNVVWEIREQEQEGTGCTQETAAGNKPISQREWEIAAGNEPTGNKEGKEPVVGDEPDSQAIGQDFNVVHFSTWCSLAVRRELEIMFYFNAFVSD